MTEQSGRLVQRALRFNVGITLIFWLLNLTTTFTILTTTPQLSGLIMTSILTTGWSIIIAVALYKLAYDVYHETVQSQQPS